MSSRTLTSPIAACAVAILVLSLAWVSHAGPKSKKMKAKKNGTDGAVMLPVRGGTFTMGSDDGRKESKPAHQVELSPFWIYRTEVTVARYQVFAKATSLKLSEPSYGFKENFPITYVAWEEAAAYCKWAGGRLPTEAEWEYAARGTDGRAFPWGKSWDDDKAWGQSGTKREPVAVGSYPAGASPFGVLDMAGNVAEWVSDHFDKAYYSKSAAKNPTGGRRGQRVIRGGQFGVGNHDRHTTWFRAGQTASTRGGSTGFRCVVGTSK